MLDDSHLIGANEIVWDSLFVGANEVVEDSLSDENKDVVGDSLTGDTNDAEVDTTPAMQEEAVHDPAEKIWKRSSPYRIENFKRDDEAFQYLTGFDSYEHFKLLLNILGPASSQLKYKSKELDTENELFLTLIKLRQTKDDYYLGLDFGIDRKVVGRIFKTWLNFLYYELSEFDFWPDRQTIDQHFPSNFQKMFPQTRVILDATEVPIQKPKHCNGQRITFSTYKNANTLKTMVGITPRGLVSYVSDSYGGSTSDRQIIERSPLLKPGMLEAGDAIMSDRGIMVQDLFASKNVKVNTPKTMKGRNQHDAKTVVRDRRISSKRIHVERVIGYAKTFKILRKTMQSERIRVGSRIIKVCFLLTNLRDCIVSKRAWVGM